MPRKPKKSWDGSRKRGSTTWSTGGGFRIQKCARPSGRAGPPWWRGTTPRFARGGTGTSYELLAGTTSGRHGWSGLPRLVRDGKTQGARLAHRRGAAKSRLRFTGSRRHRPVIQRRTANFGVTLGGRRWGHRRQP